MFGEEKSLDWEQNYENKEVELVLGDDGFNSDESMEVRIMVMV